jgi:hypothetical protein
LQRRPAAAAGILRVLRAERMEFLRATILAESAADRIIAANLVGEICRYLR